MSLLRNQVVSATISRTYHVHIPAHPGQATVPAIIVFHGGAGRRHHRRRTGTADLGKLRGQPGGLQHGVRRQPYRPVQHRISHGHRSEASRILPTACSGRVPPGRETTRTERTPPSRST
jgi:hypothetical protein